MPSSLRNQVCSIIFPSASDHAELKRDFTNWLDPWCSGSYWLYTSCIQIKISEFCKKKKKKKSIHKYLFKFIIQFILIVLPTFWVCKYFTKQVYRGEQSHKIPLKLAAWLCKHDHGKWHGACSTYSDICESLEWISRLSSTLFAQL